jgi:hypothetical protein
MIGEFAEAPHSANDRAAVRAFPEATSRVEKQLLLTYVLSKGGTRAYGKLAKFRLV